MKKTFLIIVMALTLALSTALSAHAESNITSLDLTWSVTNPANQVYIATASYPILSGSSFTARMVEQGLMPTATVRLYSPLDSFSQTLYADDFISFNYQYINISFDDFIGYGTSTDYRIEFKFTYDYHPSVTSSSIASTYTNTYFGLYDSSYFNFIPIDDTYLVGYAVGVSDGTESGYISGYDAGVSVGYSQGYIDGQSENGLFDALLNAVFGVGQLLAIEIFPNVYIGYFALVPLVFGIIGFVLSLRTKRNG